MSPRRKRKTGMLAALVATVALAASAADRTDQETVITADRLTFDYKRSVAVFERNVVAQDPQVRIETDTLTVVFDGTNDVKSVTALGNVRMISGDKTAFGDRAVYLARTGEILLLGNARLQRGKDMVSGQEITFWLHDERIVCKPGRLVIYGEATRPQPGSGTRGPQPRAAGRVNP